MAPPGLIEGGGTMGKHRKGQKGHEVMTGRLRRLAMRSEAETPHTHESEVSWLYTIVLSVLGDLYLTTGLPLSLMTFTSHLLVTPYRHPVLVGCREYPRTSRLRQQVGHALTSTHQRQWHRLKVSP